MKRNRPFRFITSQLETICDREEIERVLRYKPEDLMEFMLSNFGDLDREKYQAELFDT